MDDTTLRRLISLSIELLDRHEERWWSSKMRDVLAERELDPYELLAWFGGMGSFGDLVLAGINGHRIDRADETAENQRMNELREQIYAELVNLCGK